MKPALLLIGFLSAAFCAVEGPTFEVASVKISTESRPTIEECREIRKSPEIRKSGDIHDKGLSPLAPQLSQTQVPQTPAAVTAPKQSAPATEPLAETHPAFEVVSIKPAAFPSDAYFAGYLVGGGTCAKVKPVISGNRITWPIVTLCGITRFAYDLPEGRVVGAPDWMTKGDQSIFYAIEAKSEGEGAMTQEAAREMSRSLLADRFQLKLHRENRVLPVYSLVVGKSGPKLSQTCEDGTTRLARFTNAVASPPPSGDQSEGSTNAQRIPTAMMAGFSTCNQSMAQLADMLTRQLDRPVLDKTGLTGEYSVVLSWARETDPDRPGASPTIWTAIQEQLGLKLEPSRNSVEVLVIDHAEKPSAN